jgi:hypothetical protein
MARPMERTVSISCKRSGLMTLLIFLFPATRSSTRHKLKKSCRVALRRSVLRSGVVLPFDCIQVERDSRGDVASRKGTLREILLKYNESSFP